MMRSRRTRHEEHNTETYMMNYSGRILPSCYFMDRNVGGRLCETGCYWNKPWDCEMEFYSFRDVLWSKLL